MKYIGQFFRMNSLSIEEIESQLLFFCRESLKHIVLESRCGICINYKTLKPLASDNYIENFKNNTPLLCIYKKAKPNIYSSKYSKSWDMSTFKKDVLILPNALMTLSMLETTKYYDRFQGINSSIYNISKLYKDLSKIQLDFYYNHLRNAEGFFVNKKDERQTESKEFNFSEKDASFSFIDQGYMMLSYYLYSITCKNNKDSAEFKSFSLEILDMFFNLKENLYSESFNNCCNLCLIFNIMYEYSKNERCKNLLIDLSEFTLSKHTESTISLSNIENITLLSLNMLLTYKNTNISLFKDSFNDISILLKNLYDEEKSNLKKTSNKKDIKYYSKELVPFLINLIVFSYENTDSKLNNIVSTFYKKYFSDSGLITSFPDAPPLDSNERYKNFSLKSDDLLDEAMFRITNTLSPNLSGLAPIFTKNIVYSTKKNTLSNSNITFDSSINMFLIFLSLHILYKYKNNNILNKIKQTTYSLSDTNMTNDNNIINDYISESIDS